MSKNSLSKILYNKGKRILNTNPDFVLNEKKIKTEKLIFKEWEFYVLLSLLMTGILIAVILISFWK